LVIFLLVAGAASIFVFSDVEGRVRRMWVRSSLPLAQPYLVNQPDGKEPAPVQNFTEKESEPVPVVTDPQLSDSLVEDSDLTPALLESSQALPISQTPDVGSPSTDASSEPLPKQVNLAVPFTSQAPEGNWDQPYQDACEEASLLMVHAYYQGRSAGQIPADEAEAEMLKMVEFEEAFFGYFESTTAEQTAVLAEQFYGYGKNDVVENPTVEQIKRFIADGHPVVVPSAGRQLGNPYFRQPGPLYHMLVIKGYTKDGFITNDPGTKHGADYVYYFDVLMGAIHDWNGGDVENGKNVVLVVYPE